MARHRQPTTLTTNVPDVVQEPFAQELALALDEIERLTETECGAVGLLVNETRCEPVFAFLALHMRFAFVAAAPHGRRFRERLRAWGANQTLDRKILGFFPRGGYRPLYRPGLAAPIDDVLRVANRSGLLIGAQRRESDDSETEPAASDREEERTTAAERETNEERDARWATYRDFANGLRAGDVFWQRFNRLGKQWTEEFRIVTRTEKGVYTRAVGGSGELRWPCGAADPTLTFRTVLRATEVAAVEVPSVDVGDVIRVAFRPVVLERVPAYRELAGRDFRVFQVTKSGNIRVELAGADANHSPRAFSPAELALYAERVHVMDRASGRSDRRRR